MTVIRMGGSILALAAAGLLSACGGGGSGTDTAASLSDPADDVVTDPTDGGTTGETVETLAVTLQSGDVGVQAGANLADGGNVSVTIGSDLSIQIDTGSDVINFAERNRDFFQRIFAGYSVEDETDLTVAALPGNDPSSLDYATYGFWAVSDDPGLIDGDSSAQEGGTFFGGNTTPIANMPQTGTASFAGYAIGNDSIPDGGALGAGDGFVVGTAVFDADFGAGTMTGSLDLTSRAGQEYGDVNFASVNISANTFEGDATSTRGHEGTMRGRFFGPAAEELAGLADLTGPSTLAIAFGAKQ